MRASRCHIVISVLVASLLAAGAGCVDVQGFVDRAKDVRVGSFSYSPPAEVRQGDGRGPGHQDAGLDAFDGGSGVLPDLAEVRDLLSDAELVEEIDVPGDVDAADLCVPQCEGMECGPDMCGGLCGFCPDEKVCYLGQCVKCSPQCDGKECGADGCGGVCGQCPAKFSCVAGNCKPPACVESEEIFLEDFDSCTEGGFSIADEQPEDNVTWWTLPLKHYSPPCALFLGDPESLTYDTGASVHVELFSPTITLPTWAPARLVFDLFMLTEVLPSPLYPYDHDVLFLYFGPGDGGPDALLWSSKEILNTTEAEMVPIAIDLSDLVGQTGRFRFLFDTLDSTANDFPGIYLVHVRVDTICPYCMADEDCHDQDPCTVDGCLHFQNFPTIGGCWFERLDGCCLGEDELFCDDGDPCTLDGCDSETAACTHDPIPDCVPQEEPDEPM